MKITQMPVSLVKNHRWIDFSDKQKRRSSFLGLRFLRLINPFIFILILLTTFLRSEIRVGDKLDRNDFYVGDGILWTISVEGSHKVEPPDIQNLPGFFVRALEPQIIEQNESKIFLYFFRIIPRRSGPLTLPEISLHIDNQIFKTTARILNVAAPLSTPALRLEVSLNQKEVYVGQPFLLTFQLFSSLPLPSIKALDIELPALYDPHFSVIVPYQERLSAGAPNTIGLPVEGQRAISNLSSVKINEEEFKVITFQRIFLPLKEGEFSLPPTKLLCSHLPSSVKDKKQAFAYPSYFDNDFFEETNKKEYFIRYGASSEPLSIKVMPLPADSRPENFSGIIGNGQISLEAQPTSIILGDPITITLHLKGFESPEALVLPPLSTLAPFEGQFSVPAKQAPPRLQNQEALFTQSIRPLRTAIKEIPPLKLTIFNPTTEAYETLSTLPQAISVMPDGEKTLIDLGSESPSNQKINPHGIWHNIAKDQINPFSLLAHLLSKTVIGWTLLPLIVWLLLGKPAHLYRLKKSNPEEWKQSIAFDQFKKELKKGRTSEEQRSALADYYSTRLRIQKKAVSHREIVRALESKNITISETLSTILHELFNQNDLIEFGPNQNRTVPLIDPQKLLHAIELVDKKLKDHK